MTLTSWELCLSSTRLKVAKLLHFLIYSIFLFCLFALFSGSGVVNADEGNALSLSTPACDDFQVTQIYVDEEQLSVNAVKVGAHFWSRSMDSYYANNRILLPVTQIADIIAMPLDKNRNKITFQHPDASCSFTVELQERSFSNDAIPKNSKTGFWTQDEFDTYIDIRFLEQLVGATADVNLAKQLIILTSDTQLKPVTSQKAIPKRPISILHPEHHVSDRYHLSTFPSVDLNLSCDFNNETSVGNYTAQLNAYFDTLFHGTELRFNQNDTSRFQRLKFSREFSLEDYQQSIAKVGYEFGDIFTASDNLITSSNLGKGIYLYAGEREGFSAFNEITLQETVSPNWRGELYRNGQFIASQQANNENQLSFDAVPAFFGFNRYELKLFGPDGQQETRIKTFKKGREQLVENKLNLELYHLNPRRNFIDSDSLTQSFEEVSKLGLLYGVNQDLTVGLALKSLQQADSDKNERYITASFYKQHGAGVVNFEASAQQDKGYALFGGYSGHWMDNYNISLDVRHYNDFTSQIRPDSADVRSQIRGSIVGSSDLWGRVGWRASVKKQFNHIKKDNVQALFSATKNIRGGAISSNFNYSQKDGFDSISNNVFWVQSFRFGTLSMGLHWLPFEQFNVKSSYIEGRWRSNNKFSQISRLTYRPNNEARYSLKHRLNWRSRHFTFSTGVTVNDRGDWQFVAGFSTSIGYDYVRKAPRFSKKRSANLGNLHLLAFIDRNRDGSFNDGDAPLQNVKFAGNQNWKFTKTNEYGQALLMGATSSGNQHIGIDITSLEDPFLSPQYDKVSVKTHAGGLNRVEIPVVPHSDLEGFIYVEENTGARPAYNVPVLLKNNGEVVANSATESDGYFAFSRIFPGHYKIAIDQDYLIDKRMLPFDEELSLTVKGVGDVIEVDDIILKSASERFVQNKTNELLDQTRLSGSATYSSQITPKFEGYWVQLGVFQHLKSLNKSLRTLPKMISNSLHKIQSETGLWYLVSGAKPQQAFATKSEASSELQLARENSNPDSLLSHAFIISDAKFNGVLPQHIVKVLE